MNTRSLVVVQSEKVADSIVGGAFTEEMNHWRKTEVL